MKVSVKTKRLAVILAPLVLYVIAAIVMLCIQPGSPQPQVKSDAAPSATAYDPANYEFVFSGNVQTATGRSFTLNMLGNKDEGKTLNLVVAEMPALNMTGHWTFEEGKGYKVFLDDASQTFAYSRYNPETKTFSVMFDYDMGNFGQPRARLTYKDEAFAAQYDNVGLGRKPPQFALTGYTTYSHYGYGTTACLENGSAIATLTNTGAGWYFNRSGNWRFDEESNEFVIVFTDETISLTDGNFDVHDDGNGAYILWTKFPVGAAEPEYRTQLSLEELENTYKLFTDPYEYHAAYNAETNTYDISIEAQYNWGLGHGDLVSFWGSASAADMED